MRTPSHSDWTQNYDEGITWETPIDAFPVHELLDRSAARFPHKPAIDFLGFKQTWSEVAESADAFARTLHAQHIKKGQRIGILLPNTPYFLAAYYGALKAGATVVNLNPLYVASELKDIINDAEITHIITLDLTLLYDKVLPLLKTTPLTTLIVCPFTAILPPVKKTLFSVLKKKERAQPEFSDSILDWTDLLSRAPKGKDYQPSIDPLNDIALLQYTGGTTGKPKGAMLTHANVVSNVQQCRIWCQKIREGEQKMLAVLPFFHVFAMTVVMNLAVYTGSELIALPRFDLKQTLKTIHTKKPHLFPAVPAIYSAINNAPNLKRYTLSSLDFCIAGGAPLPIEVKRAFEHKTGCTLIEGYGLTESAPVVCANPMNQAVVEGSIGLPFPGTTVEIIDKDDRKTPVPCGQRGELCVRGPQVMKGYWNAPDATKDTLIDGRLHTGDIAIMDERGYVFVVDRIKDMIITNGYNVYPRNIEEAIYQHPAVEECIVAGLAHECRGEVVKAWVKPKDGQVLDPEDLRLFLKDKLSPMETPRLYEIRDEPLPKTMIGKLSRKDVVEQEMA